MFSFRLYYNKEITHFYEDIKLINWWYLENGLFRFPTLPSKREQYHDFKKMVLRVPVIHVSFITLRFF